jgi:hypothetical protein
LQQSINKDSLIDLNISDNCPTLTSKQNAYKQSDILKNFSLNLTQDSKASPDNKDNSNKTQKNSITLDKETINDNSNNNLDHLFVKLTKYPLSNSNNNKNNCEIENSNKKEPIKSIIDKIIYCNPLYNKATLNDFSYNNKHIENANMDCNIDFRRGLFDHSNTLASVILVFYQIN